MEKKNKILIILSYLTIYIIWGSTYFFIKLAVTAIDPLSVLGIRFLMGGLLFLFFSLISGRLKKLPSFKEILAALFLGTFLLIGGNGLITIAEQKVDSYFAALLIATVPIVVAFFDRIFIKKRISKFGILGILAGFSGVFFLFHTGHALQFNFNLHVFLVIGGIICWAFGTSMGHKLKVYPDNFVNSTIQMLFVGLVCLICLLIFKRPVLFDWSTFTLPSILSLLYLAVFGSLAYSAYNYLLQNEPAHRIVTYAFVNPLIAVFLGLVFGEEQPVPYLIPGMLLILLGLFFMLYGDLILKRFVKKKIDLESKTIK